MLNNTKNILIVGGTILVIGLLYLAYKKYKKGKDGYSNLVDDMLDKFGNYNISQFTITNNTSTQQNVRLFDAYNNINNTYGSVDSPIKINPNIFYFNQTLLNEPKKVKKIKVLVNSGGMGIQATQNMTVTCKDASGRMASESYIPVFSSSQYQSGVTEFKFDDLILNGECIVDYVVQPNTTVTLILDYDRNKKSKPFFGNV